MSRLTINILGISELRWMGMGEFNSDDHYIYYSGQESLRRNGVTLIVNLRVLNTVLGCNLRNITMISVYFQGKPSSITVIQVYAPTSKAKETEIDWFYEDLQHLLELTFKKDILFIIVDWNEKGIQEIPGIWPWSTEVSRPKANRVLSRECTGHSKHTLPTTQETTLHMNITR